MPQPSFTIILDEPLPELVPILRRQVEGRGFEVFVQGESVRVIDSSAYVHDEAAILDAEELTEARDALVEDGIFTRAEWMNDGDLLRPAVKYGWGLAHLESVRADAGTMEVGWSVANGCETTAVREWRFLTGEVAKRALDVSWISPCTPARFEPGVDYGGDVERFREWFSALEAGDAVGMFVNAADKFTILPLLSQRSDLAIALGFGRTAWMEALRVVARTDAALFREMLRIAQDRFVFDKGPHFLSTNEEDVRSLPSVSDDDLEVTFLDDFRGRQLLHVGADAIVEHAGLKRRLNDVIEGRGAELELTISGSVHRHFEALRRA